ncbi:MAG: class I SAM-dependent rRNA methyltransferase [Candidatus Omnitrophica bacterium]|nr:class I SAM-dependent rRNA methyltransferase [Candidatus Omnitrophota bacterium]
MENKTIILKEGKDASLKAGHPWIYRSMIKSADGNPEPGEVIKIKSSRGRFLGMGLYNPKSEITVRVITHNDEPVDKEFLKNRILTANSKRKEIPEKTNAYRIISSEADFLPGLIVDRYGEILSIQTLSLGMEKFKEIIADLLIELTGIENIYERNDAPVRKMEGLEITKGILRGNFTPRTDVIENNIVFGVDLESGHKTGLYCDQRENRQALKEIVYGKEVLDCFCYTGGFGLYAKHYGASKALGIDISESAIKMASENLRKNKMDDSTVAFETGNGFDALRKFDKEKREFDVIILDPPSFTKNRESLEGAIRGYKEINLRALKILRPGGYLITFSCSYYINEELLLDIITSAAKDAHRPAFLVRILKQSLDHPVLLTVPETYYLKGFIIQTG